MDQSRFCRISVDQSSKTGRARRKSKCQAIELLGCRHGLSIGAVQLPLLDHVHGLDSRNQFLGAPKRLEPQHWICDSPMSSSQFAALPLPVFFEALFVMGRFDMFISFANLLGP